MNNGEKRETTNDDGPTYTSDGFVDGVGGGASELEICTGNRPDE